MTAAALLRHLPRAGTQTPSKLDSPAGMLPTEAHSSGLGQARDPSVRQTPRAPITVCPATRPLNSGMQRPVVRLHAVPLEPMPHS